MYLTHFIRSVKVKVRRVSKEKKRAITVVQIVRTEQNNTFFAFCRK
jgi:hypothetical protein